MIVSRRTCVLWPISSCKPVVQFGHVLRGWHVYACVRRTVWIRQLLGLEYVDGDIVCEVAYKSVKMTAHDQIRAMLDQLMGTGRNGEYSVVVPYNF